MSAGSNCDMCSFGVVEAHLFVGFCGLALCFDIKELLVVVYVVDWARVFIGMGVCAWLCVDIVSAEDAIVGAVCYQVCREGC